MLYCQIHIEIQRAPFERNVFIYYLLYITVNFNNLLVQISGFSSAKFPQWFSPSQTADFLMHFELFLQLNLFLFPLQAMKIHMCLALHSSSLKKKCPFP